jgi:hypothetical protein
LALYELLRKKILERSLQKLEKMPFVTGITMEIFRAAGFDPADRVLPARSEIFSGQKFLD